MSSVKLEVETFVCEPAQYYGDHGLTDHYIVHDGQVAVINMMTQGNGKINNAWSNPNTDTGNIVWNKAETQQAYQERLIQWLDVIESLQEKGINIFIISEAPPLEEQDFYQKLLLKSLIFAEPRKTGHHKFRNLIAVDSRKYKKIEDFSDKIKNKISKCNQDRFMLARLKTHQGHLCHVFGIHGYYKGQMGTISDLAFAVNSKCIAGGDLNVRFDHPELLTLHEKIKLIGGFQKAPFNASVDALYRGDKRQR